MALASEGGNVLKWANNISAVLSTALSRVFFFFAIRNTD
jgi:hypothetical protein